MELELWQIKNMYVHLAQVAVAAYKKVEEPESDLLKQREVFRWFKLEGIDKSLLSKMENDGLVHSERKGAAKNSPKYYSRLEIISALKAIKTKNIINDIQ